MDMDRPTVILIGKTEDRVLGDRDARAIVNSTRSPWRTSSLSMKWAGMFSNVY